MKGNLYHFEVGFVRFIDRLLTQRFFPIFSTWKTDISKFMRFYPISLVVHARSRPTHQSPPPSPLPLLIFIHSFASPISIFLQFSPGEGGGGGGKVAASPRIPGACSINFSRFLMFSLYGRSAAGGLRIRLEGLYKADCYPPSPPSLSPSFPCSWFAKTCCCARSDSERRLNIFLRRRGGGEPPLSDFYKRIFE